MTAPAFDIPGYTLVRELGAGGMATVFLAVQTSLDRRVAIKVMRRGLADDNVEKRFLLEGRTMARLPHPNIVGVYDIVQNESINYIAMEFLDGGMLSDRMREGLTLAEAVSVVVQIAGALQFAHDNGIVHRDLKPANIMFRDQHTPVLTDFGIARQSDAAATRLTQTGMMIGTPTYMSPEQATGGDIDGRSDQYSLGVLFFEMLTGHPPFEGDTPIQVVLAHLNTPPPTLPPQFGFFQPLMDRLLAKNRDQRFPDLRSFSRELRTLLTSSDALLNRLQTDPNQSASEQLRGLGFSESQINTGSARISGTSPAVTAQRTGQRPAPRTGGGPGVRMEPPAREGRPRWLLPAIAVAGLLVIALGLWVVFGSRDDLDPALRNIVDSALVDVDRLIAEDKLVAPPGDNAFEKLQYVMQVAPNYPEAQRRLDGIVGSLREKAEKALASGSFAVAETRVSEALSVAPAHPELVALQQRIAAGKLAMERNARLTALLDTAEQARQDGRLAGEGNDNALAMLRQAQEIDPSHAATRERLAALTTELLAPTRSALAAGRLTDARQQLDRQATTLGGEPGWQALQAEIEQAENRLAQQKRIEELLAAARRQLAAKRIAEPAGDNALETLARVAELELTNADAARLAREAGTALAAQAVEAERKGDYATALARYDQALQAIPSEVRWQQGRRAIAERVGEREVQLAKAVGDAREAISERRYFAPPGRNARESLQQALKLDADHADSRRLLDELPKLAREAAAALAAEGRLDDALTLLADLTRAYPADAEATRMAATLGAERDRQRSADQRGQRLAELRTLLARRQISADSAREIVTALAELQRLDAGDAEAAQLRSTFLQGIDRMMASARTPEQLAPVAPVLEQIEAGLGAKAADVAERRASYRALLADLQQKERARLAALAGTLVLNAQPWATIESVVDQSSGQAVDLPADRSTPLRLSAAPGTYRVTFRHPDIRQPVVRVVTLAEKGVQAANASFPTLDRSEYLKRASHAQ